MKKSFRGSSSDSGSGRVIYSGSVSDNGSGSFVCKWHAALYEIC